MKSRKIIHPARQSSNEADTFIPPPVVRLSLQWVSPQTRPSYSTSRKQLRCVVDTNAILNGVYPLSSFIPLCSRYRATTTISLYPTVPEPCPINIGSVNPEIAVGIARATVIVSPVVPKSFSAPYTIQLISCICQAAHIKITPICALLFFMSLIFVMPTQIAYCCVSVFQYRHPRHIPFPVKGTCLLHSADSW